MTVIKSCMLAFSHLVELIRVKPGKDPSPILIRTSSSKSGRVWVWVSSRWTSKVYVRDPEHLKSFHALSGEWQLGMQKWRETCGV